MRKGQAALEYLMTYGWAILALIVVVVALFATGIMSPTYLISEECSFGNSLPCQVALFNEGGQTKLLMEMFNGYPYKIRIVELRIQTADGAQSFSAFESNVDIESGSSKRFEGTLAGPLIPEGQVKRFTGNLTYVSCAPELGPKCSESEHIISGRIVGTVLSE